MKKLLGIVVLGLLWCNTLIAQDLDTEPYVIKMSIVGMSSAAPEIRIAKTITIDTQDYIIEGRAYSNWPLRLIEIGGQPVEIKKGKFRLERLHVDPEADEELKIVVIDINFQRTEKIVKIIPNIPKGKEIKVVKQEELKSEPKDLDTGVSIIKMKIQKVGGGGANPPQIKIAETITIDTQDYIIEGRVYSNWPLHSIEIGGQPIEIKKSKFRIKRFHLDPEVDEELKIVVTETANRQTVKIVKIVMDKSKKETLEVSKKREQEKQQLMAELGKLKLKEEKRTEEEKKLVLLMAELEKLKAEKRTEEENEQFMEEVLKEKQQLMAKFEKLKLKEEKRTEEEKEKQQLIAELEKLKEEKRIEEEKKLVLQKVEAERKKIEDEGNKQFLEEFLKEKQQLMAELEKLKAEKKAEDKKEGIISAASGTGFFVTVSGHIISNNHVINACHTVKVNYQGDIKAAKIISRDRANDIALLQVDIKPKDIFIISNEDATLLEEIYVAGYPFGKAVSSSIKVTKGVVSSLSGLGDNFSNIQIDAALQPGNSGGPIINSKGNVIAIAVAKLDFKEALKTFGNIPENTNFGVKSSVIHSFTKANNLKSPQEKNEDVVTIKEIGKKIQNATVYLDCWMTAAKIEEMKSKKTFFSGLGEGFDFVCYNSCKERNDESFCRNQCSLQ